jgi:dephospho-CoA kinase
MGRYAPLDRQEPIRIYSIRILGLTGGYCAGKNEVAALLAQKGWHVIDVDKLGHAALAIVSKELAEAFGDAIVAQNGSIDRTRLGQIVFSDEAQLEKLESIVHPAMLALLDQAIASAMQDKEDKFCINAALLYRFPQVTSCRAILEVRAPLYLRIKRAHHRDSIGIEEALKRIDRQRTFWAMRPEKIPIYMVWNTMTSVELASSVARVLQDIDTLS